MNWKFFVFAAAILAAIGGIAVGSYFLFLGTPPAPPIASDPQAPSPSGTPVPTPGAPSSEGWGPEIWGKPPRGEEGVMSPPAVAPPEQGLGRKILEGGKKVSKRGGDSKSWGLDPGQGLWAGWVTSLLLLILGGGGAWLFAKFWPGHGWGEKLGASITVLVLGLIGEAARQGMRGGGWATSWLAPTLPVWPAALLIAAGWFLVIYPFGCWRKLSRIGGLLLWIVCFWLGG